jgi:deoxyribonuclease V
MPIPHPWNLTAAEARALQKELGAEVDTATVPTGRWDVIAAVDGSHDRYDTEMAAGVVVVRADTSEVLERVGIVRPMTFPYVPGLLSFREAPPILDALALVKTPYDVVMVDGQGIAHPRRLGIASHLGLWLDRPTVGCAKSRLFGKYDEPGPKRGDRSPLRDGEEIIGAVVRTKDRVSPLFVSAGHRCDLESAVSLVLATSGKYRLPTPARLVHEYVNEVRRAHKGIGPPPV